MCSIYIFLQKGVSFFTTRIFANDDVILGETMRKPSVIDWTSEPWIGNSKTFFYSLSLSQLIEFRNVSLNCDQRPLVVEVYHFMI